MRAVCLSNVRAVTRRPRGPHVGHRQSEPFRRLMFSSGDLRQCSRLRPDVPLPFVRPIDLLLGHDGRVGSRSIRRGKNVHQNINMFKLYVLHMSHILLTYVNPQHMLTHINIYQHMLMMPNICLHMNGFFLPLATNRDMGCTPNTNYIDWSTFIDTVLLNTGGWCNPAHEHGHDTGLRIMSRCKMTTYVDIYYHMKDIC